MEDLQNKLTGFERLQSLILTAAFILFAGAMVLGIFRGVTWGKDKATYKDVQTISSALQFYFSDQDRYPTATQFNDQKVLVPFYLSALPAPENVGGACSSSDQFIYTQSQPANFTLQFCLQRVSYRLDAGSHLLT